ncbi:MAG TPA: coagulation factor 5/8 type domain-containing protein [Chthoniobacterales bacterium]|nr:coagulation factor 5/8 type domain-containing protein [Chthoniobacterales bacterium]
MPAMSSGKYVTINSNSGVLPNQNRDDAHSQLTARDEKCYPQDAMTPPKCLLASFYISTVGIFQAAASQPDFGPNVDVFDPSMSAASIQHKLNAVAQTQTSQFSGQFNTIRHAFLFKPGSYTVDALVGYYTSVAGLGLSPDDVSINGVINSSGVGGSGEPPGTPDPPGDDALSNFWRSIENLHIVPQQASQREIWAVSQAAPARRMHISVGNSSAQGGVVQFSLQPQYGGYSSGGFMADSLIEPQVLSGSQQQWITRNCVLQNGWSNGNWNMVFVGVSGAPAQNFPKTAADENAYTTIAKAPITREKPFLFVDGRGQFNVFVPALQRDSSGVTWANGPAAGSSIPIEEFYIAKPSDTAAAINLQLAFGKNLILTPGIYQLDQPIRVIYPNTVVLGLGFPTLTSSGGAATMEVADVPGVKLSGILFDAGLTDSNVQLRIGDKRQYWFLRGWGSDPSNPTMIQDIFFRIGGYIAGKTETSLEVNSSNVIIDNIWAWRADHGNAGTVGWTVNTANHGLIVNGDNVIGYGLAVEHYQKYQTVWNGDFGRDYFYQSEMPYDPPTQADFSHDGVDGFASFKVQDWVRHFQGYGLGVYCFFNVNPSIVAANAIEASTAPGVQFTSLTTVGIVDGVIENIINGVGGPTDSATVTPNQLAHYP